MEKEFVNLEINKNQNNLIKLELDNVDDIDQPMCGEEEKDDIKPCIKKITNKKICYKCKEKNSKYFNRGEFVCQ